jgi:hypothetical protein
MAELLDANPRLRCLGVMVNGMSLIGIEHLGAAVARHPSLVLYDYAQHGIEHVLWNRIASGKASSKFLQVRGNTRAHASRALVSLFHPTSFAPR